MKKLVTLLTCLLVPAAVVPVIGSSAKPPEKPRAGQTWVCPRDGSTMIYVPAGQFIMGAKTCGPQHKHSLPGYWIDKLEVTNKQFLKFVRATGYVPEHSWKAKDAIAEPQLPVMKVTWKDACAYAKWAGKRLPTEAEWERAARGTDGRLYPWGNEWDPSRAVVGRKNESDVEAVGTHDGDISPVGCLDMAGNAREWCLEPYSVDAYERYSKGDYRLPDTGFIYCVRGRGVTSNRNTTQCFYRGWATSEFWWCGFRCVIGPNPKTKPLDTDRACDLNPKPRIYRSAKPPKAAKAGDVWICPKSNAEMVYIPAGKYRTGYDKHLSTSTTGAYWIGRYPISVAQYRVFLKQTKYKPLRFWDSYNLPGHETFPAFGLSYEDAEAYAKWLGFRLPNAREWEKAARGTDGRSFPWGDKYVEDYEVHFFYSDPQPVTPIGSRPFNYSPYGVADMCTMYSEWVDDPSVANAPVGTTATFTAGTQKYEVVMGRPAHVEKLPAKQSPGSKDKRQRRRMMNGFFAPIEKTAYSVRSRPIMEVAVRQPDGKTYPAPDNDWENHPFRCVLGVK